MYYRIHVLTYTNHSYMYYRIHVLTYTNHLLQVLAPNGVYINVSYGEPAERMKHFSRPDFVWVAEHQAVGTYHMYKMTKPPE